MIALLSFLLTLFASLFKSKSRLEAENAVLRHQLTVLQRKVLGRVHFTNSDRLFFAQLYRWFPSVLKAITIMRPETLASLTFMADLRCWSLGGVLPPCFNYTTDRILWHEGLEVAVAAASGRTRGTECDRPEAEAVWEKQA
jgi:hypothetical protein